MESESGSDCVVGKDEQLVGDTTVSAVAAVMTLARVSVVVAVADSDQSDINGWRSLNEEEAVTGMVDPNRKL